MSIDKLAVDAAALDPRFRLAHDSPDCFLCGKGIIRQGSDPVSVQTDATIDLHAHASCCNNRPALELYALAWKAVRAIMEGQRETPNPGPARVRGAFQ